MRLSGHTKPFAVLGHPIGHTLSPVMHNAAFRALELDAIYLAFDVAPERLMNVLPAMADMGFGGVNLTVPLKEVAFRGLAALDKSARDLGAVNTVACLPDGLKGYNTDGYGFLSSTREAFGVGVEGLSVFILGCGGAGRAVALTCADRGAARLAVTDQDETRSARLAGEIASFAPSVSVSSVPAGAALWREASAGADLVVQATPVGMKPEDPPLLGADAFREGQRAYDLVYMYPETPFMKAAREGGAHAANGLGMLMHQGARAFSIWTGREAPEDTMRSALEHEVYGN
ncbi:shikimate dehydrogenase [Verrucomicrobiota bacterium]